MQLRTVFARTVTYYDQIYPPWGTFLIGRRLHGCATRLRGVSGFSNVVRLSGRLGLIGARDVGRYA